MALAVPLHTLEHRICCCMTIRDMSCLQVREVAAEAIARARRGDGPTLIEAETYRFRGHSLADPDELRQKEEKDHYQVRPPALWLSCLLEGRMCVS